MPASEMIRGARATAAVHLPSVEVAAAAEGSQASVQRAPVRQARRWCGQLRVQGGERARVNVRGGARQALDQHAGQRIDIARRLGRLAALALAARERAILANQQFEVLALFFRELEKDALPL
jgi:hypothetical protein